MKYLSYILGLFLIFIESIITKSIDKLSNVDNEKVANSDNYYLIFVNNTHGEYEIYSKSRIQKRQASQVFVESLIDEINTLIINNKDTYENPEKLDEIEESFQLKKSKRNEEENQIYTYDGSSLVYPISSVKNTIVLYAYLSEKLAKELPFKFKEVVACTPKKSHFKPFNDGYSVQDILDETQWEEVSVRENSPFHLSLISQGKYFTDSMESDYDTNYYYPSSAGHDVDIIILDTSFGFEYSEFSNTEDRTAKCIGITKNGRVSDDVSQGCNISRLYHGESVASVAGGLTSGVANHANIYGIAMPLSNSLEFEDEDIIGGLQYVYDQMIRPHKTIINLSLGDVYDDEKREYYDHLKNLIDGITEKGGIVVAAAGNDEYNLDQDLDVFPCELDSVICVGGISNKEYKHDNIDEFTHIYKKATFSNYGKNVDIYAPSYINANILVASSDFLDKSKGTSFSSPIVAGMIATFISENRNTEYTKETALQQLIENGKNLTFKLPDESIGRIANNGKHSVYSSKGGIKKISEPRCNGQDLGYPCCRGCYIIEEDDYDQYGFEEDEKCSIRYICNGSNKPVKTKKPNTFTAVAATTTTTYSISKPTSHNECHGNGIEYPCCQGCDVSLVENSVKWGVEDNHWCVIQYSCDIECYGQNSGYPCCSGCNVEFSDGTGKWGIENNNWCGIKFSCQY